MTDIKPSIIIAQTNKDILGYIKDGISSQDFNIEYFTNPCYVLDAVTKKPVDMVITGQYFYDHNYEEKTFQNLKTFTLKNNLLELNRRMDQINDFNGAELSESIYELDSGVIVLRYSSMPDFKGKLVGDIPKKSLSELESFINNPNLARFLKENNGDALIGSFPKIKWYKEQFQKQHPIYFQK